MSIEVGQKAPSFAVYNTAKEKVVLEELAGKKILLLFFPLAFTSVCTAELCSIRDNISMYNDANATVYGISVDSPQTLNKYKEEQHLNFELLSDFNKDVSKAYDVLYENFPPMDMKGVSKRAAFVIDEKGMIRYAEVCATPKDLPDFEAIQRVLVS